MQRKTCPPTPGFVDLQVNGFGGHDFSSPTLTLDDIRAITVSLLAHGTRAYCPTVISSSMDTYRRNLPLIASAMELPDLAPHLLGIHLEGPFLSSEFGARGVHSVDHIRPPSLTEFRALLKWSRKTVRLVTLAPGLPGCEDLIREAVRHNIAVSLGHHVATDAQLNSAVAAGATLCTHLGNGIPNTIHRHQNPLWWQLACDNLTACLVTDGHHLPRPLIAVALRMKTARRIIVTSDVASLGGMPAGEYPMPDSTVLILRDNGRLECPATQSLAGSSSTMLECMNHLAGLGLLTKQELWSVGRDNALRALGFTVKRLARVTGPTVQLKRGRFYVVE